MFQVWTGPYLRVERKTAELSCSRWTEVSVDGNISLLPLQQISSSFLTEPHKTERSSSLIASESLHLYN